MYEDLQEPVSKFIQPALSTILVQHTVSQAVEYIRCKSSSYTSKVLYFYVIDENGKFFGVIDPKKLLVSDPQKFVGELIYTKVHTIKPDRTKGDALLLMQKYQLLALPIVQNGKLIGVISIQEFFNEDLTTISAKKRFRIFQSLGFGIEKPNTMSIWKKYIMRAPWMGCNIASGLICAAICNFYELILLQAIVLAMFIPLVLALSESIAMQSMTQGIYEMSRNTSFMKTLSNYIANESRLFALVATSCGILVGGASLLWGDGWGPAMVIASSITLSVLASAILGILIPIALLVVGLDPKVASGPFVLMTVDILTTTVYLSLAYWWLL